MIEEHALVRFRARVADLNALNGAVSQIERRLNDWRASALLDLNREIAMVERSTGSIYPTVAEKSKQRAAQLRAQVAEVLDTIARLEADRDRLQRRRDDANAIVCACRQLLMERGLSRTELEA